MTAAEVQRAVDPSLAYTTVLTSLVRLHEKGLVDRVRTGRSHTYTAVTDPAVTSARAMARAMEAGPDRTAVLAQFVGTLGPDALPMLRELLAEAEARQRDEPTP
jgi:predicted transcriptional regulator